MTRDATTCGHLGPACVLCGFCHACHTCHTALQPGVRPAPGWVVLYLAGLWIAFGVVLFAAVWAVSAWGGEATLEQRVQAPPGSSVPAQGALPWATGGGRALPHRYLYRPGGRRATAGGRPGVGSLVPAPAPGLGAAPLTGVRRAPPAAGGRAVTLALLNWTLLGVVIGLALVGALTVVFVSVALLKMLREDRARRRGAAR